MVTIDKNKLLTRLKKLWNDRPCPMCGGNQWTISSDLYSPVLIDVNGAIQLGGSMLPLIPITCNCCGNTIFINGKIIDCVSEQSNANGGVSNEN